MKICIGGYILSTLSNTASLNDFVSSITRNKNIVLSQSLFGPDNIISHIQVEELSQLETSVLNTFRTLVEKKILLKFSPNLILMDDALSIGSIDINGNISAWILIKTFNIDVDFVARTLKKETSVVVSHVVTGKYDIFTYIRCKNKNELVYFIDTVLPSIKPIRSFDTRIVVNNHSLNNISTGSRVIGLSNSSCSYEYF